MDTTRLVFAGLIVPSNTIRAIALASYVYNFKVYLTLVSECFSPFPHGTCSLSDLWLYLALGGIYLLVLKAALSSNPTLVRIRSKFFNLIPRGLQGYHLLCHLVPKNFTSFAPKGKNEG